MLVTKKILQLVSSLRLHNEGRWHKNFDEDLDGFSSFNDAGIEAETGELLYSFVRILKPNRILETGTHWGIGSLYMGLGLEDNKKGIIDTYEFLPNIYSEALKHFQMADLGHRINAQLMDVAQVEPKETYQLIFLDTEPQTRFAELVKFEPYLEPGGFVFIHDLHRHMHQIPNEEHGFAWPFGEVPEKIKELVKSDRLRPMHFPTPRGLTGFYKSSKDDYNW